MGQRLCQRRGCGRQQRPIMMMRQQPTDRRHLGTARRGRHLGQSAAGQRQHRDRTAAQRSLPSRPRQVPRAPDRTQRCAGAPQHRFAEIRDQQGRVVAILVQAADMWLAGPCRGGRIQPPRIVAHDIGADFAKIHAGAFETRGRGAGASGRRAQALRPCHLVPQGQQFGVVQPNPRTIRQPRDRYHGRTCCNASEIRLRPVRPSLWACQVGTMR